MKQEDAPIELELSIETLALLSQDQPTTVSACGESYPVRCWGSVCSPPTCCP